MAVMSDADRLSCATSMARDISERAESLGLTKQNLRDAVDAVDQWVSENATSYNQAIPQPARGALSAPQKAYLLTVVLRRRYETGT